jgi:hypothetical protein
VLPQATIVVALEATAEAPTSPEAQKVKAAAEDLQTTLEKMTGARLPLVSDQAPPPGPLILVGRSALTEDLPVAIPSGLTPARREEGFVIWCQGPRLLLAGNDAGPYHGTEYAVYDFLNRLGVRWFMPGEFGEIVPLKKTLTVPDLEVHQRPDFLMRNWWLHQTPEMAEQERRWKIRNKMNPDPMFATPGDSSARNIVRPELLAEHPEYFALNPDGSRNPYLPNLSHPGAVEVAAGIIRDFFRQHPEANSYGFAPDDGLPRDYDPETVKLNQGFVELGGRPGVPGEVSISEEWFGFVNRVAAAVRQEFPEVYIATNGYANRDIPPQGMVLDDHLVLMFAAIWSCTLHAYDDEHCWQKVRQGQMLRRWGELCKNVWIYGYNEQMLVSALTPIPEVHKLRRDFPLLKQWGVIGFLDEARPVWTECTIPSRYLRAQLEWNAHADVEAILKDFYAHWYGAGGPAHAGLFRGPGSSLRADSDARPRGPHPAGDLHTRTPDPPGVGSRRGRAAGRHGTNPAARPGGSVGPGPPPGVCPTERRRGGGGFRRSRPAVPPDAPAAERAERDQSLPDAGGGGALLLFQRGRPGAVLPVPGR